MLRQIWETGEDASKVALVSSWLVEMLESEWEPLD